MAAGLVFENIGARVEEFIDGRLTKADPSHLTTWHVYLLLVLRPEPIGQRYLRTLVFRLKFELGILGSLPAQLLGWVLVLRAQNTLWGWQALTVLAGSVVLAWFYFEALDSAKVLGTLRKALVARSAAPRAVVAPLRHPIVG